MRFKQYLLNEVYISDFEIMENPNKSEIRDIIRYSQHRGYDGFIRGLLEKESPFDLYMFEAVCLHDRVGKKLVENGNYEDHYWPLHGVFIKDVFHFVIPIDDGDGTEEDYKNVMKILKEKRGILKSTKGFPKYMREEYLLRHISKDWEVHKNPSYKDMVKIGKQYEKKDLQKSLRLVIDLSTDTFYAAPIGYLHDDIVDDIGLNQNTVIRALIRLEGGKILFRHIYDEDGIEIYDDELGEILDLFKNKGFKFDVEDRRG